MAGPPPGAGDHREGDGKVRTATNQTTIAQGFRLLKAGCPYVTLHMQEAAHKIVPDPIPLGRLWDIAHQIGVTTPFTPELASEQLTEALVAAIEDHYLAK